MILIQFASWCRLQGRIFDALLREKSQDIAELIEKFGSLGKIIEKWYSTLFVAAFPSETVARIWDCVFFEGSKVLHRVALATFHRNRNTILNMSHSVHLPNILTSKLKRTFDGEELLKTAFRSIGSLPSAKLLWIEEHIQNESKGEIRFPSRRSWRKSYPLSK